MQIKAAKELRIALCIVLNSGTDCTCAK